MSVRGLFAYGTLQFPEVLERVTGRRFQGVAARLPDHRCLRFVDREYPGVVPAPGVVTEGLLYPDLDAASVAALDRFEGPEYERVALRVERADGAEWPREAWVYRVLPDARVRLSDQGWSRTEFAVEGLARFLARL